MPAARRCSVGRWLAVALAAALLAPVAVVGLLVAVGSRTAAAGSSKAADKIVYERWNGRRYYLYVMNGDGSGQKRITPLPPETINRNPSWSPDKKQVAFYFSEFGVLDPVHYVAISRADGSGRRKVVEEGTNHSTTTIAWSPDGKAIAYTASTPNVGDSLRTVAPDGSGVRTLVQLNPQEILEDIAWAPDSRRIAFAARNESQRWEVRVRAANGSVRKVASGQTPAWSPDGRRIAFVGSTVRRVDGAPATFERIMVVPTSGKGAKAVFTSKTPGVGMLRGLAWSPNGKRLLFGYGDFNAADLYTVAPTGAAALKRLTRARAAEINPDW